MHHPNKIGKCSGCHKAFDRSRMLGLHHGGGGEDGAVEWVCAACFAELRHLGGPALADITAVEVEG